MRGDFFTSISSKAGGRLVRLLLLLFACFCIYALSGGLPPANTRVLAQTLRVFSTDFASYGNAFLVPFLILCIQSLLLISIWTWLIVWIVRDTFALLKGTPSSAARAGTVDAFPAPFAPLGVVQQAGSALAARENRSARPSMGTMTLDKTATLGKVGRRVPPPPGAKSSRPLAVSKPPLRSAYAPENPFDVRPSVFDMFETPDAIETSPFKQTNSDIEDAASSPFIFGNPFEGPLPEVFEYDTDLKQSLAEFGQLPNADGSFSGQQPEP